MRKLVGAGLVIIAVLIGWFFYGVFVPTSSEMTVTTLRIEKGMGVSDIAAALEKDGVIRRKIFFVSYAGLTGRANDLQAGDYTIIRSSSIPEIVKQLAGGRIDTREVSVTVIEGWNRFQIQNQLSSLGLDSVDFSNVALEGNTVGHESFLFDGKPADASFEGYLFPDTYSFFRDSTGEEMVWKMIEHFESKITPEMKQQIEASEYSLYELITLASIVEKEVSVSEDRRVVAGIFYARLNDDYLLQSDATINYVTGKNTTRPDLTDLERDSKYNTYKYPGLPPGPIGNPSLDALQAVLNPAATDYYFFLTTPEGQAVYAEDYDGHLQNKAQYYPE